MERTLFLCFSALQCHRSLPTENRPRPSIWCTCTSHLADSTLVNHSPSSVSGLSPPPSTIESPFSETIKPDDLQALWKSLQQRNVSGKAVEIILKSWSAGTQKQYTPYITQQIDFCGKWRVIPITHLWQQSWIFLSLYLTKDCLTPPSVLEGVPSPLLLYRGITMPLAATHSFQDSWKVFSRALHQLLATSPLGMWNLS